MSNLKLLWHHKYHRKLWCLIFIRKKLLHMFWVRYLFCIVSILTWKRYAILTGKTASPSEELINMWNNSKCLGRPLRPFAFLFPHSIYKTISVPLWGRGIFWLIFTGHHMVAHLCGSVSNHWSGMKLSWSIAK